MIKFLQCMWSFDDETITERTLNVWWKLKQEVRLLHYLFSMLHIWYMISYHQVFVMCDKRVIMILLIVSWFVYSCTISTFLLVFLYLVHIPFHIHYKVPTSTFCFYIIVFSLLISFFKKLFLSLIDFYYNFHFLLAFIL